MPSTSTRPTSTQPSLPTSCDLCPRLCGVNRAAGQRGFCGADDKLLVARAALHEWEEPCIAYGAGSGTVFFSHCSLKCIYCQNAMLAHEGFGAEIGVDELARMFVRLQKQDAANINLVSATHYLPQVLAAIVRSRGLGMALPVVWNTSGYETTPTIRALAGFVDVYLTDFKYWKGSGRGASDAAALYSRAPDYFEVSLRALDAMVAQVEGPVLTETGGLVRGVVVRHLLLPGRLQDSKRIMACLWERYGTRVLYSVMSQYTPCLSKANRARFPELGRRVERLDYEQLLDYLDEIGIPDYYWQEGDPAQESFIPPFDLTGVR